MPKGVRFGSHWISSLLFADDVVLLAPSSQGLQYVLGQFAAESEAPSLRTWFSTGKSWLAPSVLGESSCLNGEVQVSWGLVHE